MQFTFVFFIKGVIVATFANMTSAWLNKNAHEITRTYVGDKARLTIIM
jgi:hypothetical protein